MGVDVKAGARKDLLTVLRRLQDAGCTVLQGRKCFKVYGPNGNCITASITPSAGLACREVLRDARRYLGVRL